MRIEITIRTAFGNIVTFGVRQTYVMSVRSATDYVEDLDNTDSFYVIKI